QSRRMASDFNQLRRGWHHDEKQTTRQKGEVNTLPNSRANALGPAGTSVLRHKGGGITSGYLEQTKKEPKPHHRRKGGRHLPLVVPGQQDGIEEDLNRHEPLAENQGRCQGQQLSATARARCASARSLIGSRRRHAGFEPL